MEPAMEQKMSVFETAKVKKLVRLAAIFYAAAAIVKAVCNIATYGFEDSDSVTFSLLPLIPALCLLVIAVKKHTSKLIVRSAEIVILLVHAVLIIVYMGFFVGNVILLLEYILSYILYALFYVAFIEFVAYLTSLTDFSQLDIEPEDEEEPEEDVAAEPDRYYGDTERFNIVTRPDAAPNDGDLFVDPASYRSMVTHILLCLFTFGIWTCIWIYKTTAYLNRCPDEQPENPTSKLLLCMFIPFYQIYWIYKHAKRIDKMTAAKFGVQEDNSTVYLILALFVPVVALILMQDKINKLCRPANTVNV